MFYSFEKFLNLSSKFFLIIIKKKKILFFYKYFLYKYFLHNTRYGFAKPKKIIKKSFDSDCRYERS